MRIAATIAMGIWAALSCLGCDAAIGDSCTYDQDCSPDGDRTCDNNQPGGYCLIITCTQDSCPAEAACVQFTTPFPANLEAGSDEASYYESLDWSRTRTYCLKRCDADGDCRSGYMCALGTVLSDELHGRILDGDSEDAGVCVPQ